MSTQIIGKERPENISRGQRNILRTANAQFDMGKIRAINRQTEIRDMEESIINDMSEGKIVAGVHTTGARLDTTFISAMNTNFGGR